MIPTISDLRAWTASRFVRAGAIFIIVCALIIVVLAFKNPILVAARPGVEVEARFAQNYGITSNESKVKIGGVEVGVVKSVEPTQDGGATMTLKLDNEAEELLGSTPWAAIEPLTILGGEYAVNLTPGGEGSYDGTPIPLSRTSTPVELDRILEALPADTRTSLQGTVAGLDTALKNGGREGIRDLTEQGAKVLPPSGRVLTAARGTQPSADLPVLVDSVAVASAEMAGREKEMTSIVNDLDTVSGVLARERSPLATTIERMPATLAATDKGLADLDRTLAKIDTTAKVVTPVGKQATVLLDELSPALSQVDPLLDDLDPLLDDARPATKRLGPVVDETTTVLQTLDGPVLDRVRGPVLDKLGNTWRGSGDYKHSGGGLQADNKMYEEVGYMIANVDRASSPHDAQGAILNFQASFGSATAGPLKLDEFLGALAGQSAAQTGGATP